MYIVVDQVGGGSLLRKGYTLLGLIKKERTQKTYTLLITTYFPPNVKRIWYNTKMWFSWVTGIQIIYDIFCIYIFCMLKIIYALYHRFPDTEYTSFIGKPPSQPML